jgi:hypothetical protein
MNGNIELRLEAIPGELRASWVRQPGTMPELSLKVPLWSPATRQEMIRRLSLCPNELYALLKGRAPQWFADFELLPDHMEPMLTSYEEDSGLAAKDLLDRLRESLAEQPLLALALRGFAREELLDSVLKRWAEVSAETETENVKNAGAVLAAELAKLERKGPAISSGEWLAEAAAEGSLHQPGTSFHEVVDRPFPAKPVVAEAPEDWQELLPQTPRVQEGLTIVMRRVAEAAAKRARP